MPGRCPLQRRTYDAVVSGLVLNFVPAPEIAVREMARVARPGGTVAAYVGDYAGAMQLMRYCWDAAAALDPEALALDEGRASLSASSSRWLSSSTTPAWTPSRGVLSTSPHPSGTSTTTGRPSRAGKGPPRATPCR